MLFEAKQRISIRLLAWSVLPNQAPDEGPLALPRNWRQYVQSVETAAELAALRRWALRGTPFGAESWQERTARRLGLESTLRARGRPRKLPIGKDT